MVLRISVFGMLCTPTSLKHVLPIPLDPALAVNLPTTRRAARHQRVPRTAGAMYSRESKGCARNRTGGGLERFRVSKMFQGTDAHSVLRCIQHVRVSLLGMRTGLQCSCDDDLVLNEVFSLQGRHLPRGTLVEEAQETMSNHGKNCTATSNAEAFV